MKIILCLFLLLGLQSCAPPSSENSPKQEKSSQNQKPISPKNISGVLLAQAGVQLRVGGFSVTVAYVLTDDDRIIRSGPATNGRSRCIYPFSDGMAKKIIKQAISHQQGISSRENSDMLTAQAGFTTPGGGSSISVAYLLATDGKIIRSDPIVNRNSFVYGYTYPFSDEMAKILILAKRNGVPFIEAY